MRSETCRGEEILYDFNVFFNKYTHEFVTNDTDFIHARFKYENYWTCHLVSGAALRDRKEVDFEILFS